MARGVAAANAVGIQAKRICAAVQARQWRSNQRRDIFWGHPEGRDGAEGKAGGEGEAEVESEDRRTGLRRGVRGRLSSGVRVGLRGGPSLRPRNGPRAGPADVIRGLTRRAIRVLLCLGAVGSLIVGGRWAAFSVQDIGGLSASARSTGHDALWLGHMWVDGRQDAADVAALAAQLSVTDAGDISDLFVHVGPTDSDGTLDPALRPRAAWFVATLRTDLRARWSAGRPQPRIEAWIGDTVLPEGSLDLESAATRQRILAGVRSVLADGFQGVHYDFEPIGSGDPGYLALLDATRPIVHAAGGQVSVSAEQVEPAPGTRFAMEALERHSSWWSAGYLHQVAERVDEVAIMSYDTALWSPSAYSGFVRDETEVALSVVPSSVTLVMGVPAYHTSDLGHSSSAETVAAAIRGVRLGLSSSPRRAGPFGVAVYVDFTATPADWAAYLGDWVHP